MATIMAMLRCMGSYVLAAMRIVLFVAMVLVGLLILVLIFPVVSVPMRRTIKQYWSRVLVAVLGLRVVVTRVDDAPMVGLMVSNHTSWIDIFAANAVQAVTFIAKSDIRDWPVLGALVTLAGTVYVERGNRATIEVTNQAISAGVAQGDLVGLYPEGTTTDGTCLLPFKSNLLQPAVSDNMWVYPVAVSYRHRGAPTLLASYADDTSLWQSLLMLTRAVGVQVHIQYGAPIRGGDYADRAALTQAALESIVRMSGLAVVEPTQEQVLRRKGVLPS